MRKPEPEDFGMTNQEYVSLVAERRQLWQGNSTKFTPENSGLTNQEYAALEAKLTQLVLQGDGIQSIFWIWLSTFFTFVIVGGIIGLIMVGILQAMGIPIENSLLSFCVGVFVIGTGVVCFKKAPKEQNRQIQSRQKQNILSDRYRKVACYEKALGEYQNHQESYWKSLRGVQFERALANLYRNLGHSVQETKGSGDEGIDLILDDRIIVQCKGHEKQIGVGAIRDLYGTLKHHTEYKSAVLACPAGFSGPARKFADGEPIELLTAKELVEMAERVAINIYLGSRKAPPLIGGRKEPPKPGTVEEIISRHPNPSPEMKALIDEFNKRKLLDQPGEKED